jgi:hypothetical protein
LNRLVCVVVTTRQLADAKTPPSSNSRCVQGVAPAKEYVRKAMQSPAPASHRATG